MHKESLTYVSVIVPVYKTPLDYFKQCLDSLHNQTLQKAEFIIVFDGKHDELQPVCNTYEKKDNRFKSYIQPHLGVSSTRNFGIEQANSEYIAFVDADDILVDGILEKALLFAKENSSDIVIWDCVSFSSSEKYFRQISDKSIGTIPYEIKDLIIKNAISTFDYNYLSVAGPWSKLYKKELFLHNQFDPNLPLRQDRALNIALFQKNISLSYLHENGYLYRLHENSAIRKYRKNLLQECCAYLKCVKEITNNKYKQQLGLEAMQSLWIVWSTNILNKQNDTPLFHRVKQFINAITSDDYNSYLSSILNFDKFPLFTKIELKLFQHKITITLWIRAFFWKISS